MRIIHNLDEMIETARGWLSGGSVGFIPTMGYLHAGHVSLIQAARQECEITVVSIFVNPLQFGPGENPGDYPRNFARDIQLLEQEQVDVLFAPRPDEMYPPDFATYVHCTAPVAQRLEGAVRPEHVQGYATIITKLLQIIRPDIAYFGQKNAQHVALVRQVVLDLNIDVQLCVLPALRQSDGLALSSRNHLLTAKERRAAPLLYKALLAGKALLDQGERQLSKIEQAMSAVLATSPLLRLDYATACDPDTFTHPGNILPGLLTDLLLVVAVRVGRTFLVDNLLLRDGVWMM